ncbi:MAG: adenylyltransferase/cytidyltransferase family protein [Candidatus Omnitrophica bacterium]|nr:MAG: Bifunctional protein HldE [Candidatus Hinthialibacteria bacterium OLB16]MBW7937655.1 adenylyltransferase/cytidyltransferase family protein [Candidatus Omnitrophota bacterium]MCK6497803.1 adenylyltransferase/cytidyltransferase family protein [bacterium]NUP92275.1 adenylyltransferase/cytidyltransferase family protein [Candidatus Omnitrophota bacterium]
MGKLCRSDAELQCELEPLRRAGKQIVTTNGCFDIVSYAHLVMLREAKSQGEILVVGVNSDLSVNKLKGPTRPIRPELERASIIAAFDIVDFVILFDEKDCTDFVTRVRPNVHVNDASYGEDCIESQAVKDCGGRLYLVPKFEWESNTQLLERIKTLL